MKIQRCLQLLFAALSIAMVLLTVDFYRADQSAQGKVEERPRYVFLAPNNKENYWCSIAAGVKAADEEFHTDTLLVAFSGNENIRSYFMDAVLSDADGIIVKGTGRINAEIQAATTGGVPVVFYDSDSPGSGRSCYVGVDNYETGVQAARVLAEQLQGEGKLLAIVRSKSAFSQEDRVAALEDELEQYPELEIVEYIEDQGDALILKENLLEAIRRYPDLDGILCMEEIASENVGNLLREQELDPERYFILSLDFSEQTAGYLEDGTYDMVLMYDTRQIGYRAVEFLNQYREHQSREAQSQAEQSQAEQSQAEQSQAEQSRAEQSQAEQSRAEQGQEKQGQKERSQGGPSCEEQSQAEQSQAEQSPQNRGQKEQSQTEPGKEEQGQKEPNQETQSQTEPQQGILTQEGGSAAEAEEITISLDNVRITKENVKEYQKWYEKLPPLEWNIY